MNYSSYLASNDRRRIAFDAIERTEEENILSYFKIQHRHSHKGAEETRETTQDNRCPRPFPSVSQKRYRFCQLGRHIHICSEIYLVFISPVSFIANWSVSAVNEHQDRWRMQNSKQCICTVCVRSKLNTHFHFYCKITRWETSCL
jgi:hypothetical protein